MEDISVREQWFKIAVFAFKEYENKMLDDFYNYWSEPTKNGKKMKFELEKTWDTKRRLKRWYDNNQKWNGNNTANTTKNLGSAAGATLLLNKLKQQLNG